MDLQTIRKIISRNIHEYRLKKYPGRGGSKRCAKELGVSTQQWTSWETGVRLPDELRLKQIATIFGVQFEELLPESNKVQKTSPHTEKTFHTGIIKACPLLPEMPEGYPPGSPTSCYWFLRHVIQRNLTEDFKIQLVNDNTPKISRKTRNHR